VRLAVIFSVILLGCSDPVTGADAARDVTAPDAPRMDAAVDAPPTDLPDVPAGEVGLGASCSLNRECAANARCQCASGDCRCMEGPRGTGRSGVARCTSGDDCESSLCVDGNNGMLCSDACTSNADCPPALPRCITLGALSLSLCARDPNAPPGDGGTYNTMLTATFGARGGPFDSARHGRQGTNGIYLEAYLGGDPACPEANSPTPQRTLVLTGLRTNVTGVQTSATGVRAVLLDFSGGLIATPTARATMVEVTPQELGAGTRVRADIRVTFEGGTITGVVDAPWCRSLDDI
jgi:hypothetical protein